MGDDNRSESIEPAVLILGIVLALMLLAAIFNML